MCYLTLLKILMRTKNNVTSIAILKSRHILDHYLEFLNLPSRNNFRLHQETDPAHYDEHGAGEIHLTWDMIVRAHSRHHVSHLHHELHLFSLKFYLKPTSGVNALRSENWNGEFLFDLT